VSKRSIVGPLLLIGGGAATAGAIWFASRRSTKTTESVQKALSGGLDEDTGLPVSPVFDARLTGYWPKSARPDELKMEGGLKDRRGNPLHTLEDHQKDPVAHPFVSVAGDYDIFPYGQRIVIDQWPGLTFRVVDTGGHFHGASKLYRVLGHEPLDINVDSSKTTVPKLAKVTIVRGDNFEGGKAVASGGFKGQTVVTGTLAPTADDHEALARAIESELGSRTQAEQHAAAWALRNRSEQTGLSLHHMLAPKGVYGAPHTSGGFASTRKAPSARTRQVASTVLGASAAHDPTEGAVDYWVPSQQLRMRQLGDIHRAAKRSGDVIKAKAYERYAGYGTEGDVRAKHASEGLRPTRLVGVVELLGRG